MNNDEIIEMADKADAEADNVLNMKGEYHPNWHQVRDEIFAKLVAAKEREALEVELLKLKQGVAANSDYIQGRWDLIGEFQDIIRSRS